MAERLLIGTRKGLFDMRRYGSTWRIDNVHFLGDPVTVAAQLGDGAVLAALALGHFGATVRRLDAGANDWQELDAPAFPPKPNDSDDKADWSVGQIMALQPGGGEVETSNNRPIWRG